MAYVKKEWHSGDIVTSAALNNLEVRANTIFNFVPSEENPYMFTLDGSWNDIKAAVDAGSMCWIKLDTSQSSANPNVYLMPVLAVYAYNDGGMVYEISCGLANSGATNVGIQAFTAHDPDEHYTHGID